MKVVLLSQGMCSFTDDEDFELVSQYKWYASNCDNKFYARTTINSKKVSMHRLVIGAITGQQVDHINGNTLDNRKENLRLCTTSQNSMNSISNIGSSKYKGVHWHKKYNKWYSSIRISGRKKHLGSFNSEEEAALAYNKAATMHFGEFARLNTVQGWCNERGIK